MRAFLTQRDALEFAFANDLDISDANVYPEGVAWVVGDIPDVPPAPADDPPADDPPGEGA